MPNSGNIWPAAIGVFGTLAGAITSALVAFWNARNTRIREEVIFARAQDHAQEERVRATRALVYEEWLRVLRTFMEGVYGAKLDERGLVDEVAQIFDRLELHASKDVRRAATTELDIIRTYSTSLTERPALIEQLRTLHEEIVTLMRRDLA